MIRQINGYNSQTTVCLRTKLQMEQTNGRTKKSITSVAGRSRLITKCNVCAQRNERELSDLHASNHNLMFNLCVFFLRPNSFFSSQFPPFYDFIIFSLARAPGLQCATCSELRCTLFALHLFMFTVRHYSAAAISPFLSPNNFIFAAHSMHRNNFERL